MYSNRCRWRPALRIVHMEKGVAVIGVTKIRLKIAIILGIHGYGIRVGIRDGFMMVMKRQGNRRVTRVVIRFWVRIRRVEMQM